MNSFGRIFRLTSFGESHGVALGGVVDGCPPGLALTEKDIQQDLDRRRPGQSKFTTQRREKDQIEILSGVFEGKTTGTPIGLLIRNTDARSKDYNDIKDSFRPGHADFTYQAKYGIRDYRGGGRSSARETAIRVAAGAIARKYLRQHFKIDIAAAVVQVGDIYAGKSNTNPNSNPFFVADAGMVPLLEDYFAKLRKDNDSVGACVQVVAKGVPAGWGSPVFGKLDGEIAGAMMGINAVKGVEIGAGFASVSQKGSEHRDEMVPGKGIDKSKAGKNAPAVSFLSNDAGGILGGISNGDPIVARIAFKPTSSILKPGKSVNTKGKPKELVVKGRHDPCVGLRAVPIVEAMLALVLMDQFMAQRSQCG